ncbi:hypothetical protein KKI23_02705 [Patescibacteria group bacterium]|nr:hypothetical protein [Patescibacteria group bacterium]
MESQPVIPVKKGKKFVLVMVIVVPILLAVFVYYYFFWGTENKSFDITPADQVCQTDDDCVFVWTKCACECGSPVNKIHKEKYKQQWQEMCANYKGIQCSMTCNFVAQCVNETCIAVEKEPAE